MSLQAAPPLTRVLVIGGDSVERDLFERWQRQGLLPNLSAFATRATRATVINPPALESSSVWPTFHSGLRPGFHPNFDGPTVFNPATYGFDLPPKKDVPEPIWIRLSQAGQRCAVIDPPYSTEADGINGIAVIDWSPHVSAYGTEFHSLRTVPESFAAELLEVVGPDPGGGKTCDHERFWTTEDFKQFIATTRKRIEKRGQLARHMLRKGDWDYFEIVFMEPHCVGHHLWHLTDPDHPEFDPKLFAEIGDPTLEIYKAMDREFGEILALLDDRTHVLFYGSHGMGPQITGTGLLDRLLMIYEGTADNNWREAVRRQFRPIWRALPIPLRSALMPTKRWALPIDRAFSLGGNRPGRRYFEVLANNRSGAVRVNLVGREANGLVAPEDYDRVLDELSGFLKEFVHADTGEPLVAEIVKTHERYRGPFVDRMPDLLVTWNRKPIRDVSSPRFGKMTQIYYHVRSGDHTPEGFFYAAGPGLRAQELNETFEPVDLQPTIERWLGLPSTHFPDHAGGTPIETLICDPPPSGTIEAASP